MSLRVAPAQTFRSLSAPLITLANDSHSKIASFRYLIHLEKANVKLTLS